MSFYFQDLVDDTKKELFEMLYPIFDLGIPADGSLCLRAYEEKVYIYYKTDDELFPIKNFPLDTVSCLSLFFNIHEDEQLVIDTTTFPAPDIVELYEELRKYANQPNTYIHVNSFNEIRLSITTDLSTKNKVSFKTSEYPTLMSLLEKDLRFKEFLGLIIADNVHQVRLKNKDESLFSKRKFVVR